VHVLQRPRTATSALAYSYYYICVLILVSLARLETLSLELFFFSKDLCTRPWTPSCRGEGHRECLQGLQGLVPRLAVEVAVAQREHRQRLQSAGKFGTETPVTDISDDVVRDVDLTNQNHVDFYREWLVQVLYFFFTFFFESEFFFTYYYMCSHTLTTIYVLTTYTGVGCFGETLPRVTLYNIPTIYVLSTYTGVGCCGETLPRVTLYYILLYMSSHTIYVLSTCSGVGCCGETLPRVTLGRKSTSEAANNLGF